MISAPSIRGVLTQLDTIATCPRSQKKSFDSIGHNSDLSSFNKKRSFDSIGHSELSAFNKRAFDSIGHGDLSAFNKKRAFDEV